MNTQEHTNEEVCVATLLDLISYELYCGRLSPEMKYLLKEHIVQCPDCKQRVCGFLDILTEDIAPRGFG
jgi:hypothetical protein